jgi:hypothetical protein
VVLKSEVVAQYKQALPTYEKVDRSVNIEEDDVQSLRMFCIWKDVTTEDNTTTVAENPKPA